MDRKYIYLDLETGGLNPKKNPILQFSAIVEINSEIVENIDYKLKASGLEVDPKAVEVHGLTGIEGLPQEEFFRRVLLPTLDEYINKYDSDDKFYLIGYNCHSFDVPFLRELFVRNNNNYFGSYFFHPSVDVMLILAGLCVGQRHMLGNFKLPTVAKSLGLEVNEDKLHDSFYDVSLTRELWKTIEKEIIE